MRPRPIAASYRLGLKVTCPNCNGKRAVSLRVTLLCFMNAQCMHPCEWARRLRSSTTPCRKANARKFPAAAVGPESAWTPGGTFLCSLGVCDSGKVRVARICNTPPPHSSTFVLFLCFSIYSSNLWSYKSVVSLYYYHSASFYLLRCSLLSISFSDAIIKSAIKDKSLSNTAASERGEGFLDLCSGRHEGEQLCHVYIIAHNKLELHCMSNRLVPFGITRSPVGCTVRAMHQLPKCKCKCGGLCVPSLTVRLLTYMPCVRWMMHARRSFSGDIVVVETNCLLVLLLKDHS